MLASSLHVNRTGTWSKEPGVGLAPTANRMVPVRGWSSTLPYSVQENKMVRAKFACHGVSPVGTKDTITGYNIYLGAVYNNPDGHQNEENKRYWELTPAGTIQLHTVNEAAANAFKQGKQYYVDFTEAE